MARSFPRALIALTALSLVLAACGSSGSGKAKTSDTTGNTVSSTPAPFGGSITVGAEEEPDCFDWLGSCSGSAWGTWMAQLETVPYAYRSVVTDGKLEQIPGPVLTGAPKFEATPVETITYNIEPKAVWSDGVPITCADFQYVVDQQQHGKDLYDPTGYTDIASVTCPTPKTAVVKYKPGKTYANWQALFGSGIGILPSHILKGKDRAKVLDDGYTWSGGPWIAKWNKGESIVLTRNPKYWGPKAHLDKVTFLFESDTAAEFQAFKSAQVDAIYPAPQVEVMDAIKAGIPDAHSDYTAETGTVEALFYNNQAFPFDSKVVRQATGYAIDRDAIVKKLFGALDIDKAANSLNSFVVGAYADLNAWANYHLDLDKVDELMTGDGWKKDNDGIWAKGGKKASFNVTTTSDNKLRELTEQIIQPMFKTAGFDMKIKNTKLDNLLQQMGSGNYQIMLLSQSLTAITPGLCDILCTKNIPTDKSGNSGNNWSFASVPAADPLMETVDSSLDDNARKEAGKKADELLADANVALPLDPSPDIAIWSTKIVGPVSDNPIESMFWNIDQWGVKQ
jgi:peptide/nickel transport system substrate-binding protein